MVKATIASEFFEAKPELVKDIKVFEKRRNLQLLHRLYIEEDAVNFFSLLTEIRFGLFFDPLCTDIAYNISIDNKKPDYLLSMNDQGILAEVLRLNTPEEECRSNIENNLQLRRFQKQNPDVPIIEFGGVKCISLEFLSGNQSKLANKEIKYRKLIDNYKFPFIICVAPTLQTYLNEIDFYDFLMGQHGFFATNEYFGRNVTGVLLNSYFGEYIYYHNEHAQYQLNRFNKDIFGRYLFRKK